MLKKLIAMLLVSVLLVSAVPFAMAANSDQLSNLTHNCPNTGKMMPEYFDPNQTTYLLTVADWVSRVSFTPTSAGTVYVNGNYVPSGSASPYIQMTDEPQAVNIQVTNGSSTTTYTVYLQRRPSERRTRVSAGYITEIYQKKDKFYIAADLVSVNYRSNKYSDGSRSTFTNDSDYLYRYKVDPNCAFFYEKNGTAHRAKDIYEFQNQWANNYYAGMYRIVYMEDEIVAVLPYSADY